jgi:serine protease inhibitor
MSKSTKASSRKKKSVKKTATKKTTAEAPAPTKESIAAPLKLEREDQLILQLAYSELQNKQYQLQNANREMEDANGNWNKQLQAVNEKYGLNPTKDKIDLGTGVITKG